MKIICRAGEEPEVQNSWKVSLGNLSSNLSTTFQKQDNEHILS